MYRCAGDSVFSQETGLAQGYHPAVEGTQKRPLSGFGLEPFVQLGTVHFRSAVIRVFWTRGVFDPEKSFEESFHYGTLALIAE